MKEQKQTELKTSVAVVGAGHAGIEAALASARMGVDTVLFTLSLDGIANMPCNPSIGGTAKGHLVYEIDALGGEMGYAADRVTLQSRTLNLGKGAAVQSKRIQADRQKYHRLMKQTLESTPHLRVVQAEIVDIGTTEEPYRAPEPNPLADLVRARERELDGDAREKENVTETANANASASANTSTTEARPRDAANAAHNSANPAAPEDPPALARETATQTACVPAKPGARAERPISLAPEDEETGALSDKERLCAPRGAQTPQDFQRNAQGAVPPFPDPSPLKDCEIINNMPEGERGKEADGSENAISVSGAIALTAETAVSLSAAPPDDADQSASVPQSGMFHMKHSTETGENDPDDASADQNANAPQSGMFHMKHSTETGENDPDDASADQRKEHTRKRRVCSVTTRLGEVWSCDAVVIATGTYLAGAVFVGNVSYEAGPDGSLPAKGLSDALRALGVKLVRFKTGTPARVQKRSIDFSALEEQPGETGAIPYSARTPENALDGVPQIPCHIVYTNAETHRVIRENISRSAMYSGKIHGTGPRYCPSIEDKLVRFADKERHQLFVEPLGEDTNEMYLQGFSTSLPTDVQHAMLHTLRGFENAEIMRYAYAIEYDCADPTQMDASLAFKSVGGLYGAGQFNGTSGYEEAAAQGLVAGINAARAVCGLPPVILSRTGSYIGTLIDDLVTKGTNEPYRMMTSRSEYRLLLRQDNADERLTRTGYRAGLVTDAQFRAFSSKKTRISAEKTRLETTFVSPASANPFLEARGETPLKTGASLADLLRRPAVTYEDLAGIDPERPQLFRAERMTVEYDIKYEGYATRQMAEVRRQQRLEEKHLPADLDYGKIRGLRIEAAQKLEKMRPLTIGQASRISGVNPADISVLLIYLGLH